MIRNFKVLGLVLTAVFAMSAIAASNASAQTPGKLTSDGPVTLTATEQGAATENALTAFGGVRVTAAGSKLTGHKYNVTPHTFIPSGESTVTLTPDYNQASCVFFLVVNRPCTITMTGCDFVLHGGETTPSPPDTYGGTADIVCPPAKFIDIEIWPQGTKPEEHPTKALFCNITVAPQTGLGGADLNSDTVNDDLAIKGTVKSIALKKELAGCGAGETKTGELHLNGTITGKNEAGGATGVTVTH